ncbi:hypothetical protein [Mycolicibacterium vaccae]|uniref:hypothetical protein n=1 Tax=Mycolicibacterium vaccae TaxID=1810 RepID=UPI003D06A06B
MDLTHFGHSCLMARIPGTAVLFDPGNFSHGFDGLTGLAAIVNFLRAVAPEHAVPIHHGMVDPSARGIYYGRLTEFTDVDLRPLEIEQSAAF